MMISRNELVQRAQDSLFALVASIPRVCVDRPRQSRNGVWDFEVHLQLESCHQQLLCNVRSRAWPSEIYSVAHRFQKAVQKHVPEHSIPVLIAPYFSPQAIEYCAELGLSWADFAGNGALNIKGAYIKVLGNANSFKLGRGTASLYSPQSSRVAHALLLDPSRKWTTEDLAETAGVSLGQVSSVKKLLRTNNWIRTKYGETLLTEPRKLLDDWSLHYKPRRKTIRFFTLDTPEEIENKIASTLSDYAFTELSASDRYAPYTRHQRVALYVSHWQANMASSLGLRTGDGAGNVTIYETGEKLPFISIVRDSNCVSPIQTYLDLKLLAGRGQDSAEHLLEFVIEPGWR